MLTQDCITPVQIKKVVVSVLVFVECLILEQDELARLDDPEQIDLGKTIGSRLQPCLSQLPSTYQHNEMSYTATESLTFFLICLTKSNLLNIYRYTDDMMQLEMYITA